MWFHVHRTLWLVGLCVAWASTLPSAQSQTALTWENIYLKSTGAREAAVSPDGTWVAVTAATEEKRGIYLVPTQGGEPTLWAEGHSPSWSRDSTRIVFLDVNDIWTVELNSRKRQRVTSGPEDERAPVISPDGKSVAFYSTRGGHHDIWLVPTEGGEARQLTEEAMAADDFRFAPAWSPDGHTIAYISNRNDYWEDDVWLVEVENRKARRLSDKLMASSTPVWSPDGKQIALLGTSKDEYWYEDLAYIYLIDVKDRDENIVEMQVLATDYLHNHQVFWSEGGARLYFLYHERGDLNLWAVAAKGGLATRVSHVGGAVRSFSASGSGDAFALVRSDFTRGYDVDYITYQGGEPRRLTHFAKDWVSVQEPREIAYRSFDGLYIQGFLYLPPGLQEGARYPALVHVHGGGTNSYLRRENLIEQYLASQGYIVLAINYRGGSGFGREFQDLSINDWCNGQAKDAAAAADFLRTLPYCNDKVGIYGYSYGGIMTMATIARHPGKFDAAVPMAGIYDFADAYTNADRVGKIFFKTGHGGSPDDRREIYDISNTLARVKAIETPLLIMHGEEDVRAPFRQYELAVKMLEENGKVFEAKSYPSEPHGFRDPNNRIDMYQRLEEFFGKYLK